VTAVASTAAGHASESSPRLPAHPLEVRRYDPLEGRTARAKLGGQAGGKRKRMEALTMQQQQERGREWLPTIGTLMGQLHEVLRIV
jgi:hypothetical protein